MTTQVTIPTKSTTKNKTFPKKVIIKQNDLFTIRDNKSGMYLNISDNCSDISLNPSIKCLKWGEKQTYPYSSFKLQSVNKSNSNDINFKQQYYIYSPYMHIWFSDSSESGNISSITPSTRITINPINNMMQFYSGDKYSISTKSNFFYGRELILEKINFS
jgi:hypothetical protein